MIVRVHSEARDKRQDGDSEWLDVDRKKKRSLAASHVRLFTYQAA